MFFELKYAEQQLIHQNLKKIFPALLFNLCFNRFIFRGYIKGKYSKKSFKITNKNYYWENKETTDP